jgi:hypothetical protein
MSVEALIGDKSRAVVIPMHPDEKAVILAGCGSRIGKGGACGASGVVPDFHLLAAAIGARVFVAGLAGKTGMIRMTYIKGHPKRLGDAPDGGIELIADMLRIFLPEALDDAGLSRRIAEITKWRELHPMILARLLGRELVWEKEGNGNFLSLIGEVFQWTEWTEKHCDG